jgi:hypothetical protein
MNLQTALDGIGKGLLEPILGMNHLLFCLTAGLVLVTLRKKPADIFLYLLALIPGYVLERNFPMPSVLVNALVALTVAFSLLLHWMYEKLAGYTRPLLVIAGVFHGLSLTKAATAISSDGIIAYAVSATVIQGLVMYGFGVFCHRLSIKAPDGYETVVNLLSATGAGVALAYFFLAF